MATVFPNPRPALQMLAAKVFDDRVALAVERWAGHGGRGAVEWGGVALAVERWVVGNGRVEVGSGGQSGGVGWRWRGREVRGPWAGGLVGAFPRDPSWIVCQLAG